MNRHPFYSGTYDGHDCVHQGAESRVEVVKGMTAEQCHAALKLPHLQKTVITALNRRLMKLEKLKINQGETA